MKLIRSVLMGLVLLLSGIGSPAAAEQTTAQSTAKTTELSSAVKGRRVITFIYKKHARTVEPHALGIAKEGKPALLAWQASGESSTESPPGWRVFLVEEIEGLTMSETRFTRRDDYHQGKSRGLKTIEVEAPAPEITKP